MNHRDRQSSEGLRGSFRIVRIAGIDLRLHYTWLIIAFLITVSLSAHFRYVNPGWSAAVIWASSIVTGLLFFVGLFAHELAHAFVAKARGLPIRRITLFLLGGMAQIEREASDAATEFWMAISGPIASVVFGFICLALAHGIFGWQLWTIPHTPGAAILAWLGYINFVLAAFNMIPGFPMDGGRVLRAIAWWITKRADTATRFAATVGQIVGWLFIAYGVFRIFTGAGFGGIWLAIIGWFLIQAAAGTLFRTQAESALHDLRVADVMSRDCGQVNPDLDIQSFVDDYLLRSGQRCYTVTQNGYLLGLITPHEIRGLPRERWRQTRVRDAMRPLERLYSVGPDTPLMEALDRMSRQDINQLPVVSGGNLLGVLSRAHILEVLRTRSELRAA